MENFFKWFTLPNERLSLVRIAWFVDQFGIDEFNGAEKLLWAFLRYCADLDIPALRQYLDAFIQTESRKIIKKYSIRLDTMDNFRYDEPASFEEACRVICSTVSTLYDTYCQTDLTDRSFKVDMNTFITEAKTDKLQEYMAYTFPRFSNGDDVDDVILDTEYRVACIKATYDKSCLDNLDFLSGETKVERGVEQMRKLFDTGIPAIDGDVGGVFSKMLFSFTGSPGTGKTRFACAHFAYRAMVVAKIDVLFDELELSEMEVRNMLIAHHIVYLYGGKVKIPDSDMNKGNLSPEQQRYYEAAKMDLFESGKYGKIHIRTKDLIVEAMKKDAYAFFRRNRNCQLWIIDYVGLGKSQPINKYDKRYDGYEIIVEIYKNVKDIIKIVDIAALLINQFNEKGIEAASMGKRIQPGHVQGGQIVSRHADYDLAMCRTEEQELANMATLSTVKKRAAKGFQNKPLYLDLAVSIFRQGKE